MDTLKAKAAGTSLLLRLGNPILRFRVLGSSALDDVKVKGDAVVDETLCSRHIKHHDLADHLWLFRTNLRPSEWEDPEFLTRR